MAASPARSPASSGASLRGSGSANQSASISIDTLVNHLLAAKRSLSSITHVLRANELATSARHAHEDISILAAQAAFLRSSIIDQAAILVRLRRSLQESYDWGKRDFKTLVKAMDEADGELENTMRMLRGSIVGKELRPVGEGERNLLDFVDEKGVDGMREAMKKSIEQLQSYQQSFDGDLLRFDTDIRNLKKIIVDAPPPDPYEDETLTDTIDKLLEGINDQSSNMAILLASLTKHFDMCVTAIRTTEGAADLARRKVAEVSKSQQDVAGVSISGVIAEQEERSVADDLEPKTKDDRVEMLRVVVQDAEEVGDVVAEIQERLSAMESDHLALTDLVHQTNTTHLGMLDAYALLQEIGDRLGDYLAAEDDFQTRWSLEKDTVASKVAEMREMREFYEGYASAYSSLLLEVERRRGVDEKVRGIWRKAKEAVDKILEADATEREGFRQDVGEFLPTDLWGGLQGRVQRWEVVPVEDGEEEGRS